MEITVALWRPRVGRNRKKKKKKKKIGVRFEVFAVLVEEVCNDLLDELIHLKNDYTRRDMFDTLSICDFWAKMCVSYLCVAKECITKLLSFSCTCLCESRFSILMQIKNQTRNRLDLENVLQCALSSMHPRTRNWFIAFSSKSLTEMYFGINCCLE